MKVYVKPKLVVLINIVKSFFLTVYDCTTVKHVLY